jgi:hypothetical protein
MKAMAVGLSSMTSVQFHRDNHFVPCVYLKGWAGPDGKIATYRVLVPHDKFSDLASIFSKRARLPLTPLYTNGFGRREG